MTHGTSTPNKLTSVVESKIGLSGPLLIQFYPRTGLNLYHIHMHLHLTYPHCTGGVHQAQLAEQKPEANIYLFWCQLCHKREDDALLVIY